MSIQYTTCKNCESNFKSNFSFCPHCGQNDKEKLTVGVLFYNTISNYFSFDARFFKSFIPLLIKPGFLAKKFVGGKRLLYLHPAQMYLFIAIVFFFLFSFNANKQADEMDKGLAEAFDQTPTKTDSLSTKELIIKRKEDSIKREEARKTLLDNSIYTGMTEKQIDSIVNDKNFNLKKNNISFTGKETDSLIKINAPDAEIYKSMGLKDGDNAFKKRLYRQALKFLKSKKGGNILKTFYDTVPIAMFFVLPIFAFIIMVFYRKRGSYSHHLVFSFYYFAFIFTVFSFILGINFIYDIPDWIDALIIFSVFIYLILALKQFYNQGWFKTFLKGSLSTMVFFPILIMVAAFVLFFSFMFY